VAEETGRNRTMLIAFFVIAIAAVGGVAFYAGRHNAQQEEMRPVVQRQAFRAPNFTRLPPQKFGNWTLVCIRDAQQATRCNLVFQAVDNTRRRLVMRIAVMRTNRGRTAMAILTPPNALVAAGVKLTPGSTPATNVPFLRCLPRACEASVVVTDTLLKALEGADTTQVSFVSGSGKPVAYKLPTQGFKEGYAAWQSESPPPSVSPAKEAPPAAPGATPSAATATEPPAATPAPVKRPKAHAPPPAAPKEQPSTP
jgi:invasion protein IalB